MEIGQKIRKLRELRNYSQEYMAEKLGISQVSFSRVENGQTKLNLERLNEIAIILNIKPIFLLNFDENLIFKNSFQYEKIENTNNSIAAQERKYFIERIVSLEIENEHLRKQNS